MRKPANIAASVRARLLNLSRERNEPFQLLLTRYVLERLLYRLSLTAHRDRFVLKGAMLMTTWFENAFRPTQDLDLLGFGNPEPEVMRTAPTRPGSSAHAQPPCGRVVRTREGRDQGDGDAFCNRRDFPRPVRHPR